VLENTNRLHRLLAGAAGATLVVGLAVSAGAVPRPGDNGEVRTAAVSEVVEEAAPAARQPGDSAPDVTVPAPAATEEAAQEAPTTTAAATPKTTTAPPTTKAPVAKPQAAPATSPAPAAAGAPAPAAPAAPAKVARRTPSSAEIQGAIGELKRQVGGLLLLVSPTAAQINQVGDQVCTAFDSGQTFAQVKATALSMIPASVTVLPSTADWAVRQAVTLYCPGHASKLV
jgi:hypothetical protein